MTSQHRKIFDAHLHIIDYRFPVIENQGYVPPEYRAKDYRAVASNLGVVGGAVVAGSFQGTDTRFFKAAFDELGAGFVGVAQLPSDVADDEIERLDALGIRAIRFNIKRGTADVASIDRLARRVHDLAGWHSEFYIDGNMLNALFDNLRTLPAICIDHLGLDEHGHANLLRLVEKGAFVKATGFGRVDVDVPAAVEKIVSTNPDSLVFGTDLPSTRARRPFEVADLELLETILEPPLVQKVLLTNALKLYRVS